MRIIFFLTALICFPTVQGEGRCEDILKDCLNTISWTRCFEDKIANCTTKRRSIPGFVQLSVNASKEVEANLTNEHRIVVPFSALQKSRGSPLKEHVKVVAMVINSTYFRLAQRSRGRQLHRPEQNTVLGDTVLAVKIGYHPLKNLSQPIKLIFFKRNLEVANGTCVFWVDSGDGKGRWSTDGCKTTNGVSEYICSCNHLSFFAVLVNPVLSVDEKTAVTLSYITYIGSSLSAIFSLISLIIYICLRGRRTEKSLSVHMQLTGALLCLHLGFLLSSFSVQTLGEDSWVCRGLGFFLHWALLASLTWAAVEGFHLYLLLVRVFNIYVRRYILKLSLVGWGLPTLVAGACAIWGVYGKYDLKESMNQISAGQICWMSSQFPQHYAVAFVTTVAFPCLVLLYNGCMLGLVVLKMWRLRQSHRAFGSIRGQSNISREKISMVWKDCATVLGLSCVLGLPWGLMSTTYISTAGIYIFTILNSLQGVFVFLWTVALACKSRTDDNTLSKDTSSQKIITTTFTSTAAE
ncbi:adhesion G-protein coupled receptor G1-like isoform X1 [Gouania willdenowi]|uniref:Adhesion G-protein coupled receptor G5-like n=1 Tax=Gouania willdenowi TaxID=441366 RepID=A0A8C5EU20_GOUWI|nr:adhesion G-protein coupled receptor G1-like isoform X1 [Gouania willdenowi]